MVEVAETTIEKLVSSHEIEKVKTTIVEKYGFTPTDEYVKDLIAFVDMIVERQHKLRKLRRL